MIKVEKDLNKIPDCLNNGKAYNCDDVKTELKKIYNKKCCYCETKLTKNYEIEHFRPESKYKWLKESWSNLLLVCSSCNKSKLNRFETLNPKLTNKVNNINIHESAEYLNEEEKQLLFHPEYEDAELYFEYEKSGKIKSNGTDNDRAEYTIKLVNLNHIDLIATRYNIIEEFIKENKNKVKNAEIQKLINNFAKKCNKKQDFSAFRKYILKNHLKEIISNSQSSINN